MFFQGRGNAYLAEVVDGVAGKFDRKICPDSFSIDLATDQWEHINKCGPVDVPDASGDKASSGSVNFSFANVEDRNFALAVLGTVVEADTGSVVAEELPGDLGDGDWWFLGVNSDLGRHRNITNLVITGMTVTTDYVLDADSGRVTFVGDQAISPPPTASYDYSDPAAVSMLTAAAKEFAVMFEYINKQSSNDPGSLELYRVKFSPASNMDFMTDELQIPQITGKVLADTTKDLDGELGQFGRRVS